MRNGSNLYTRQSQIKEWMQMSFTDEVLKPLNNIIIKEYKGYKDTIWIHYDNARVHSASCT